MIQKNKALELNNVFQQTFEQGTPLVAASDSSIKL